MNNSLFYVCFNAGALHSSCLGGDGQVVSFFLEEQGMDPNQLNSSGNSPLYYAVNGGHYNVTEMLLTSGADPSLPLPPRKGKQIVFVYKQYLCVFTRRYINQSATSGDRTRF